MDPGAVAEFDHSDKGRSGTGPSESVPSESGPDGKSERQVAVAVRDSKVEAARPRIIAKGHGKVAEQILNIAFDRGVKVRSDADLAEILAAVDVDCEIPLEALAAVSEILTYVYRATQGASPEAGQ